MTKYLDLLALGSLVFFSASATAELICEVETTETLNVNMQDIQLAKIAVGPDVLTIEGIEGDEARIDIRKCASSQDRLDKMDFIARREGEIMIFEADPGGSSSFSWGWFGRGGGKYGRFTIHAKVPARLTGEVKVGSGEATVSNLAALDAKVSSGDLVIRNIDGKVSTRVSSGIANISDTGPLYVSSIGSGEVEADQVDGDIRINTIGSGRFLARQVGGSLSIGSIGSGSARVEHLTGSAEVDRIGSGNVRIDDVDGDVTLGAIGSGSARVNRAGGDVSLEKKGSGSLRTSEIQGQIRQPDDNKKK